VGIVPDKNLRSAIGVSGIGVFLTDGKPTWQLGIVPDKNPRSAIEGIRDGRDEVLEESVMLTAVQMIDSRLFATFPLKANVPFRLWEIAVHLAEPVR